MKGYTKEVLIPTESAEKHCGACNIYQNRVEDAELLEEVFGTEGQWDYKTCFQMCERQRKREQWDSKKVAK